MAVRRSTICAPRSRTLRALQAGAAKLRVGDQTQVRIDRALIFDHHRTARGPYHPGPRRMRQMRPRLKWHKLRRRRSDAPFLRQNLAAAAHRQVLHLKLTSSSPRRSFPRACMISRSMLRRQERDPLLRPPERRWRNFASAGPTAKSWTSRRCFSTRWQPLCHVSDGIPGNLPNLTSRSHRSVSMTRF